MPFLLAALYCLALASDADRNEAAIKKYGESRTYRVLAENQSGTRTMKTRVETVEGKKVAVLEDVFNGRLFEKEYRFSTSETASLDRFRLMSCKLDTKAGDEETKGFIETKGSQAVITITKGGNKIPISREITGTTVSEAAMIRLLCAQEQKVAQNFKVDMFDINKCEVQNHAFSCLVKETIEIEGKKFDAFKWQEEWTTKPIPGESAQEDYNWKRTYWISVDGYLLKRKGFDGTLVLEVKSQPRVREP